MLEKLPFRLARFFIKDKSSSQFAPSSLPSREDAFLSDESIVSFYAAGSDSEENIRAQLLKQFPKNPDKIGRILNAIKLKREKGAS